MIYNNGYLTNQIFIPYFLINKQVKAEYENATEKKEYHACGYFI